MCIFIFVNWDTLVPWAYQLCCLPSINNTKAYTELSTRKQNKLQLALEHATR